MSDPVRRSSYATTEIVMILRTMMPIEPKSLAHPDLIGFVAERAIVTKLAQMFTNGTAQEVLDVPV